ncbi:unnamed protein product [Owenia fusiformis]|uniref:Uncharacterized protein n=1 Tax=Owenia fusiformis TaxID=6347 RepID=A0A8J1UQW1_OWEFU|nr:unnamed protein product [Owenia fusiformis]
MDLLNMPVTLVVKAPNQKIADQTVECELEWTIRKLKQHLEDVYPSKPKHNQQRLIYSGKLLTDQLVLKDVLRQDDTEILSHTVHLVCSQQSDASSNNGNHSNTQPQTIPRDVTPPAPVPATPTETTPDGLRHRGTQPPQPQPQHSPFPHGAQDIYSNYYNSMYQHSYTPEQWMYMQHMYAQQMQQYMHYYQQMGQQMPAGFTPDTPIVEQPANQEAEQPNQAANQDQNIRMNAQGGQDFDDEDERNRDWLDWSYTFIRFGVLLSILYFYSTLHRFMIVFTVIFLLYIYNTGFFRLNRREPAPQRNNNNGQQQQQQNDNNAGNDENNDNENDITENVEPAEPPLPAQPGVIKVAFNFFVTFFSSLIPQQPGAVNAN